MRAVLGGFWASRGSWLVMAACLAAAVTSAQAACPSPGDLAGPGIAVRDDSGGVTTFRSAEGSTEVTETTRFDDNSGFFIRSAGGLLVQESHDIANGERVSDSVVKTELENPGDAFPVAEGRRVEISGVERAADAADQPVTVVIESSLMRRVVYGDCALTAIPVQLTYDYGAEVPSEVEYLDYLPEFGIALYLGGAELGAAPDIYRIIEIFTAPPE